VPPGRTRLDALSVLSFLAGPIAFVIVHSGSYFLVPEARGTHSKLAMDLVSVLAVLVIVAGAWAAVRVLRAPAAGATRLEDRVAERARFLAIGGLLLCAFFLGVVVADTLPKLLLTPWD
jgi:cytochrome c biogenesis factor